MSMSDAAAQMAALISQFIDAVEDGRDPGRAHAAARRLFAMSTDPTNSALMGPLAALADYLVGELAQAKGCDRAAVIADLRRQAAKNLDDAETLIARLRGQRP